MIFDFESNFEKLTGFKPLKWQSRLYAEYLSLGTLPAAVDIPTGLGKTSIMAIWYLALKAEARLLRRLVYVVDRRAVVDQATEIANQIKEKSDDKDLRISTLRGQYVDNREWLEDPGKPAIIVGTVDMIGSRLLFEGYGVSRRMRPYHAGLLGADTLVMLDESHLVPPFERLLRKIAHRDGLGPKDPSDGGFIPPFRLLPLSATGKADDENVFRLTREDRNDEIVAQRLDATKRLTFEPLGEGKLEEMLAGKAWEQVDRSTSSARVLVYCNSRDIAEKTKQEIEKLAKGNKKEGISKVEFEIELFVGARRFYEREKAKERLDSLGFFSGGERPEKPAFVISTSAGEVGVDLDADRMVMDLVPFERMVQRLGRLNRLGKKDSQVIVVEGAKPESMKEDAPTDKEIRALIAWKAGQLLRKLSRLEDGSHDASPGALVKLKENTSNGVKAATTADPLYPALTRALVDAWSMTLLQEHTGRPEVQPWLRGWVEDPPQTTLVWRRYLPVRTEGGAATEKEINNFWAAVPPHLTEKLEANSFHVRDWLTKRIKRLINDSANPFKKTDVVAYLVGRANEQKRRFTLEELAEAAEGKKAFERAITGLTLVLDARIGGLSDDGLLADKTDTQVSTADAEGGWFDSEKGQPRVPFRIRRIPVRSKEEGKGSASRTSEENGEESGSKAGEYWQSIHAFDQERDAEGLPIWQLVVDKWYNENPDEDARSITRKKQLLEEHQAWAAKRAQTIVDELGLQGEIASAIVTATRLHDEGKRAERWQRAFSAPRDEKIYAKTKGPLRLSILGGYRHEFGSLLRLDNDNEFTKLPDEMKDLVRHLVAAHHGRARPVIETVGCGEAPPTVLEAHSRDAAIRFAKLQKRFGPWGLAWLEALVRAADQQASRDLDKGRDSDD